MVLLVRRLPRNQILIPVRGSCEVVFLPQQTYDLRMKRIFILLASLLLGVLADTFSTRSIAGG